MIVVLKLLAYRMIRQPLFWLALIILSVGGCDSCSSKVGPGATGSIELYYSDTPVAKRLQSPLSPLGMPVQTPDAPHFMQSPESPGGRPVSEAELAFALSQEKVQRVELGMSYKQVTKLLEVPAIRIAGENSRNTVYRWKLDGMGFMGRFENEVLVRSNIIHEGNRVVGRRKSAAIQYDQNVYDAIQPGMSYEEVLAMMGGAPEPLTDGTGSITIYKWVDTRGSSIIGRFENGVLMRKSGKILGVEKKRGDTVHKQESVAPDITYRFPITRGEETDIDSEEGIVSTDIKDKQDSESSIPPGKQVYIAGKSRRKQGEEGGDSAYVNRSYKPMARFPAYSRRIRRGDFEIRIHNHSIAGISVAVITEKQGVDAILPAGGTASFFVGRGNYDLYYIYEDEPFTLFQAQQLPVSNTLADYRVEILDDSYHVSFLDRNTEPSSMSWR